MSPSGQNEKVSQRAFLDCCTSESGRSFELGERQLRANCGRAVAHVRGSYVPILLKKSLMISGSSDSVAVMRFAVEAGDDGAARSRSRAAVLFILS